MMASCGRLAHNMIIFASALSIVLWVTAKSDAYVFESTPFVASLQDSGHRCSASVVHERFVLTAASCLVDEYGRLLRLTKILVGTNDLANGGMYYPIEKLIPHERYSVHSGDFNIGLVKVEKIAFGPTVGPIKLGEEMVGVYDVVNVVGWISHKGLLHEMSVVVVRNDVCQGRQFGRIISPRMLCAGVRGRSDCVCDEGGPVLVNQTLAAVVSPFSGCGTLGALYTRVAPLRSWIVRTIERY